MKSIPERKKPIQAVVPDATEFDLPDGMKLHKVGNVIRNSGKTYRCLKVSPSNAIFQNVRNVADIEHFSNCHDKTEQILSSDEGESQTNENQQTEKHMAKKTKTETNVKPGKIEFIESLLDGKLTKAEIAAQVVKEYKVGANTAKNTVNWTCSTFGTRNAGKVAKFKEVERAPKKPAVKKPASKKPAAKKSPPKRKAAAKPVEDKSPEVTGLEAA